MSIRERKASTPDLDAHSKGDWKTAHGIWDKINGLFSTYVPMTAATALTMTMDAGWHDLDLSASVASTVFAVRVQFIITDDLTGFDARIRPNGSSLTLGEERATWQVVDAADANMQGRALSFILQSSMVDQYLEYYVGKTGGTVTVNLIGYWKKGL